MFCEAPHLYGGDAGRMASRLFATLSSKESGLSQVWNFQQLVELEMLNVMCIRDGYHNT